MKGGRTAPRDAINANVAVISNLTSMKGGRTAPRDVIACDVPCETYGYFNEGGADCPP